MATYLCVNECYWNARLWGPGDVYEGEEIPPKHFQLGKLVGKKAVPVEARTLAQAQDEMLGKTKLANGKPPKTLAEANDMFS